MHVVPKALAVAAVLVAASTVHANPRALPFTYTTDTVPADAVEVELFADLVPLRAISATTTEETTYLASAFQVELEIGLTDRLELGLYLTWVPTFGDELAGTAQLPGVGNGLKQRLRYRLADDADAWPVNVGLYGELAENEREIEVEA